MHTPDEMIWKGQRFDHDVMASIGLFVLCNLEPGSLGQAILYGRDNEHLVQLCHPSARVVLPATTDMARALTRDLFEGLGPRDTELLHEARCLLKLADLHRFWWLLINNTKISNALVEPFSPVDFERYAHDR